MDSISVESDKSKIKRLIIEHLDDLLAIARKQAAKENPDNSLQASAVVNEVVVKMLSKEDPLQFNDKAHFLAAFTLMVRHCYIDRARSKGNTKNGGDMNRQALHDDHSTDDHFTLGIMIIQEELQRLVQADPLAAQVVQLKCMGHTIEEIAEKLQIKLSKAKGEWAYGQAKLLRALKDTGTRYQI
jgi:RNA polymerase sigma factor (TIGR02999 family)